MPVMVIVAILLAVIALIQNGGFVLLAGSVISGIYYSLGHTATEWRSEMTFFKDQALGRPLPRGSP